MGWIQNIFNSNEAQLRSLRRIADRIEALDSQYSAMTDEELQAQTAVLKARLAQGEPLDDLLPEAFATAREAAWRVLHMKPFYVQLIGGIVLHQGRIAEMRTGEGKTLTEILPAYLNALTGKGVHIITVNDYLASRDCQWMGQVYDFLGLTTGLIYPDMDPADRKAAYQADITYGTNSEFGFDYLRDNMVTDKKQVVQRGHVFAIVDEIDSILIDEARTPLIISGQGTESDEIYIKANHLVRYLKPFRVKEMDMEDDSEPNADYVVDEKAKTAMLTSAGIRKAERYFCIQNLADPKHAQLSHHINQALKAHGVMQLDVDYVVKDGGILIVDEFTGRIM
ncbi:MAG: preprotein translocase subunit SecA, partial [Lachnospiraceae bacterium]|nr:preprotein translocase subunit SecA [Lachnospiraceae bacterium]